MTHPVDPDATAADWAALSRRLERCALGLTGSREQAEELTQQTLANLLARKPDRAHHLGYARRTMLRLWLDERRAWRRRLGRLARIAAARARWHRDGDPASDRERARIILRAAADLPPRQHAVLVLRLVEELEYTQIAEALACSVASVRSNLHLARNRIREQLGETGGDA